MMHLITMLFFSMSLCSCCTFNGIIFFNNSGVEIRVSVGTGVEYQLEANRAKEINLPWSDVIFIKVVSIAGESTYEFYPLSKIYMDACRYKLQMELNKKIYAVTDKNKMPINKRLLNSQPYGYPLNAKQL